MESNNGNLSREELSNLRFPLKLWVLINTQNEIINWGRNGSTVLINIHLLDLYLSSESSIFKTKNISSFIRQMNLYGYQKINQSLISENNTIHEYRNENFQINRLDRISEILRRTGGNQQRINLVQAGKLIRRQKREFDPCHSILINSKISKLAKSRLNLRILLAMKAIKKDILNQTLIPVVEVSTECYEKLKSNSSKYVAGFYGEISDEIMENFFGSYSNSSNIVTAAENNLELNELQRKEASNENIFSSEVPIKYSMCFEPQKENQYYVNVVDTTNQSVEFPCVNFLPHEHLQNFEEASFQKETQYIPPEFNIDEFFTFNSVQPTEISNKEILFEHIEEISKTDKPGPNMPIINESEEIIDSFYKQIRDSIEVLYEGDL